WQNFGSSTYFSDNRLNKLLDAYLVYTKQLNKINLDLTAGYSYQNFESEQYNSGNMVDPNSIPDVDTRPEVNLQSYFGRLNVDYDKRYLVTLNYRRDGTSRFSPDYRWGDFYGGALAWRISEERFLESFQALSELKLRFGMGVTGQQDISSAYEYIPRYMAATSPQGQYQFGGGFVLFGRPQGYNTGIKWEETTDTPIVLDYGFFNNRLSGYVNFFQKESKDLLAEVPYPDGANLSNKGWRNFGSFTTKGVEFMIDYDIIRSDKFNWNANFNMFYNEREIDELDNGLDTPTGDIEDAGDNQIQIHTDG